MNPFASVIVILSISARTKSALITIEFMSHFMIGRFGDVTQFFPVEKDLFFRGFFYIGRECMSDLFSVKKEYQFIINSGLRNSFCSERFKIKISTADCSSGILVSNDKSLCIQNAICSGMIPIFMRINDKSDP